MSLIADKVPNHKRNSDSSMMTLPVFQMPCVILSKNTIVYLRNIQTISLQTLLDDFFISQAKLWIYRLFTQAMVCYFFPRDQGFQGLNTNPGHVCIFVHFDMLFFQNIIHDDINFSSTFVYLRRLSSATRTALSLPLPIALRGRRR